MSPRTLASHAAMHATPSHTSAVIRSDISSAERRPRRAGAAPGAARPRRRQWHPPAPATPLATAELPGGRSRAAKHRPQQPRRRFSLPPPWRGKDQGRKCGKPWRLPPKRRRRRHLARRARHQRIRPPTPARRRRPRCPRRPKPRVPLCAECASSSATTSRNAASRSSPCEAHRWTAARGSTSTPTRLPRPPQPQCRRCGGGSARR
mmetsp:Transcript_89409/g.257933  ORF Transcript_89409/g.257933 Transcript_89409/m.257933 type:complete len:206 (+) Transcript_89409:139-756(+)